MIANVVALEALDVAEVVELAAVVLLDGAAVVVVVVVGLALLDAASVVAVDDSVLTFGHLVRILIFSNKSGFCLVSFLWHSLTPRVNLQNIPSFQASKSLILLLITFRNRSSCSDSFSPSCLSTALDSGLRDQFGFLFLWPLGQSNSWLVFFLWTLSSSSDSYSSLSLTFLKPSLKTTDSLVVVDSFPTSFGFFESSGLDFDFLNLRGRSFNETWSC